MSSTLRLNQQFKLIKAIRQFFWQRDFTDVMTPPLVKSPGIEPHIHPFKCTGLGPYENDDLYLHTSPEFAMKELLSLGYERIFNLSYAFRHEPSSSFHRPQFLMLEWYRAFESYQKIMDDVVELVNFCAQELRVEQNLTWQKKTVREIFHQFLQIDLYDYLELTSLRTLIEKKFPQIPLPPFEERSKLTWDDYFFLLFLNEIEPHFKSIKALLLYEYPHHLSALSTLKKDDPRVCERFEVYLSGVELCNCYNELTDIEEQKKRFVESKKIRQDLYSQTMPKPNVLFSALERGLPSSTGVALRVERLLMSLTGLDAHDAFWSQ